MGTACAKNGGTCACLLVVTAPGSKYAVAWIGVWHLAFFVVVVVVVLFFFILLLLLTTTNNKIINYYYY